MTDTTKMVFGEQFQIKLDPAKLEAKTRKQWGDIYLRHSAEKAQMYASAGVLSIASLASIMAAATFNGLFLFIAMGLCLFTAKTFFDFGYQKGILDDWETKIMVRVDK